MQFFLNLPVEFKIKLQSSLYYAFFEFLIGKRPIKPYSDVIKGKRRTSRLQLSKAAGRLLRKCEERKIFQNRTQTVIMGFQYLTELPEHIVQYEEYQEKNIDLLRLEIKDFRTEFKSGFKFLLMLLIGGFIIIICGLIIQFLLK